VGFITWCGILELVRTHFAACLPAKALAQADDNFPPTLFELRRTSKFFFSGIQLVKIS